ncbi:MAG: hypothetical protein CVV27_11640 [Candidatus Melainabacteria bacterium HGW-Melainabacteria-1]|nr:MAG: hypothetical protein CVV27_11640 [Candidatus Melainabacteria bacterium HGW-Melainabacteria-1]
MSQDADARYGLELDVLDEDKLSFRLNRIRHRGPVLTDFEALRQKADAVVDNITYLDDRLRLVEQDEVQQAILLRSETPLTPAEGVEYLEVRLTQDGVSEIGNRRYNREHTETTPGDMVLSHRQLERLGQDLQQLK